MRLPLWEHPKCNFLECVAGSVLSGSGWCFLKGEWDNPNCPKFESEEEIERVNNYLCEQELIMGNRPLCYSWESSYFWIW